MFIVSEDNLHAINSEYIVSFCVKHLMVQDEMQYYICATLKNGNETTIKSLSTEEEAKKALLQLLDMLG